MVASTTIGRSAHTNRFFQSSPRWLRLLLVLLAALLLHACGGGGNVAWDPGLGRFHDYPAPVSE